MGVATYTDSFSILTGSCGFPPTSLSEPHLVALSRRLMYFSIWAGILNPNYNPLCGTRCVIRNRETDETIVALVVDAADTDEPEPVLSRAAFEALGGDVTKGKLSIGFPYDRYCL